MSRPARGRFQFPLGSFQLLQQLLGPFQMYNMASHPSHECRVAQRSEKYGDYGDESGVAKLGGS